MAAGASLHGASGAGGSCRSLMTWLNLFSGSGVRDGRAQGWGGPGQASPQVAYAAVVDEGSDLGVLR